jgi:hypothetical protein
MRFPSENDVRSYWQAAKREWWAGKISRAEYQRRIHDSVVTFHHEKSADENWKTIQWLHEHQGEWNREVIAKRKTLIRRYLKQSKMTAEEFLARLIETWRCITAPDAKAEAVRQCIVRKLESIQKEVTVQ